LFPTGPVNGRHTWNKKKGGLISPPFFIMLP
jgi:hypothetical protein